MAATKNKTKRCSTNNNPIPPCPDGYVEKKNKKGEDCCYKIEPTEISVKDDDKQRKKEQDKKHKEEEKKRKEEEKKRKDEEKKRKEEEKKRKEEEKKKKEEEKKRKEEQDKKQKEDEKKRKKEQDKKQKEEEKNKRQNDKEKSRKIKKENKEKRENDEIKDKHKQLKKMVNKYTEAYESKNFKSDIIPSDWVMYNRKAFPKWITKTFQVNTSDTTQKKKKSCDVREERLELFPHQKIIRDYLQHRSPYRGLLLYHGLGVGKTCASISVAEVMINNRDVIVMAPASLKTNYLNEILKCGHEQYSVNQHWKFKSVKSKEKVVANIMNMDVKNVKKHKGIWLSYPDKEPNFKSLSIDKKQEIILQIKDIIQHKYNFMNYNGITKSKYNEITSNGNIFDNKLIIIDEAHLFISAVVNKSRLYTDMYRDLLNAVNAKIVLLTGTPIVNYPNEIAYTLNLIKGQTKVYEIEYSGNFGNEHMLSMEECIDTYTFEKRGAKKYIEIVLTPYNFRRKSNGKLTYKDDAGGVENTDEQKIENIVNRLKSSGVNVKKGEKGVVVNRHRLLPTESDAFNKKFIDFEANSTKNNELFMKRIMGLVSYYESGDLELYPEPLGVTEELLHFSDHQFNKYATMRDHEIKKEQQAKKKSSNMTNEFQKSGVFKTFSRILCNFAFPSEIERPFPKNNVSLMVNEMDDLDGDFEDMQKSSKKKDSFKKRITVYQEKVKNVMAELKNRKDEFLKGEKLVEYSPKYARIIHHTQSINGCVLIYSQFRSVEGLGVMALALEAAGYAEMKVTIENKKVDIKVKDEDYMKPKYAMFSTDKEVSDVLLKIFNSDLSSFDADVRDKLERMDVSGNGEGNLRGSLIKVMMITQSGSAGISLKNVRQVHVMEPYWNKSRIDQVIGRANRTCSHIELLEPERNFRVYTYRMILTDQQKKRSMYIKSIDDNKSTDQSGLLKELIFKIIHA